jgi:multidrug efflux pump subunit AcrA (membrane-fusion protein)
MKSSRDWGQVLRLVPVKYLVPVTFLRAVTFFVTLLVIVFVDFEPFSARAAAADKSDKKENVTVVTERANPKEVKDELILPGRINTSRSVDAIAELDGVIQSCAVDLGAQVAVGTKICSVRSSDPGFTSDSIAVLAPVKGAVQDRMVGPGSAVKRGDKIATIIPMGSSRFVVDIPYSQVSELTIGAVARLESLEGKSVAGVEEVKCVALAPSADPVTATIRSEWVPVKGQLSGGQVGRIRVVKRSRNIFILPEKAVIYEGNKPFARLVRNEKIELVPLELGPSDGDTVEIVTGIATGDMVVLKASGYVKAGDTVTVENSDAAPRAKR